MPKRIGLLTLPLHINYGGIAQAAALAQHLRADGHEVILLDKRRPAGRIAQGVHRLLVALPFQNIRNVRRQAREAALHKPFVRDWIGPVTPPLRSRSDLSQAVARLGLDAVIVGSDQVWRLDYLPPGGVTEFFLDMAPRPAVRKVAYAASFGVGEWAHPEMTDRLRPLIADFDAVSVREASGVPIVREVMGREQCDHVLDPTLMVDPAVHHRMAAPARPGAGRVLLRYTLDGAPDRVAIAEAVADVRRAQPGAPVEIAAMTLESSGRQALDLPQWLRAFRDADFVVTDSFHGVAFSIIFRKDFVAIPNHGRGIDRFLSLLSLLGLEDRLIAVNDPAAARACAARPIDHVAVAARLDRLRTQSRAFLESALA